MAGTLGNFFLYTVHRGYVISRVMGKRLQLKKNFVLLALRA